MASQSQRCVWITCKPSTAQEIYILLLPHLSSCTTQKQRAATVFLWLGFYFLVFWTLLLSFYHPTGFLFILFFFWWVWRQIIFRLRLVSFNSDCKRVEWISMGNYHSFLPTLLCPNTHDKLTHDCASIEILCLLFFCYFLSFHCIKYRSFLLHCIFLLSLYMFG